MRMSKRKITIAVSGLNNTDNPGPGVPVIRGIRESETFDARIIGLAYENLEPGIYMHDVVDKTYQVPYPSDGTDILVNRILEIHRKDPIDMLIPNFDAELYAFMKSEEKLLEAGIRMYLPTLEQFEERHKSNLPEYGACFGVYPKYIDSDNYIQVRIGMYGGIHVSMAEGGVGGGGSFGGFVPNLGQTYAVVLTVAGDQMTLTIDGVSYGTQTVVLSGVAGRVGFYTENPTTYDDLSIATATVHVVADFAEGHTLTATASPTAGGTVARDPDKPYYSPAESVDLTANAADNYRFDEWTGDLTGDANPASLVMDADKTVTANFIGPLGDLSGPAGVPDGYVDHWDLFAFAATWHAAEGDPAYDPLADFDGTGYVDHFDLFAFAAVWHQTVGPAGDQMMQSLLSALLATPDVKTDDDHADTLDAATEIALGETVSGTIDSTDDADCFRFAVPPPGGIITVIETSGETDTALALIDLSTGNDLAHDDDSGGGLSARIVYTADESGDVGITVTGVPPLGGRAYTLTVEPLIKTVSIDSPSGPRSGSRWRVRGRVLDGENTGVADARVILSSSALAPVSATSDKAGAFRIPERRSFVTSSDGVLGLCVYSAGGEAVALTFTDTRKRDARGDAPGTAVFLTLSDVADLVKSFGDSALADAAYAERVVSGVAASTDAARVTQGVRVCAILRARLATAATTHGLPLVDATSLPLAIYDGPLGLLGARTAVAAGLVQSAAE